MYESHSFISSGENWPRWATPDSGSQRMRAAATTGRARVGVTAAFYPAGAGRHGNLPSVRIGADDTCAFTVYASRSHCLRGGWVWPDSRRSPATDGLGRGLHPGTVGAGRK